MPRLDRRLQANALAAIGIVRAGEVMRSAGGPVGRAHWTLPRLESLYELAYMRVFANWESCLEGIFHRSLCGYAARGGRERLVAGAYFPNIMAAELAVLGGQHYKLWHNPNHVIARCQHFILPNTVPGCPALMETALTGSVTRLEHFASVRHRITHEQRDARNKFDNATRAIAGRTFPQSRPGKFLRSLDRSSMPHRRWLEVLIDDLVKLAGQMV